MSASSPPGILNISISGKGGLVRQGGKRNGPETVRKTSSEQLPRTFMEGGENYWHAVGGGRVGA